MNASPRSGIIGTGMIARVHAQAVLASGGTVASFAGSSVESARAAAAGYQHAQGVASVSEMIDLGVDVIHICTPNALHRAQAQEALAAGIPVICEKPLATTAAAAAALVAEADSAAVVTAVPFVYRYYPMVLEARARIASRSDNRLWLLHGSYLQDWLADSSATNWRVDPELGGVSRAFGDIGVHWCDLMEFVTGQRIVRVNAKLGNAFRRGGSSGGVATEDGGVISFETDSGALGSLVVSQVSAGRRNRLWFSFDGPHESYSFDQEAPETLWLGGPGENRVVSRDPSLQAPPARHPGALPAGHPQGYQTCFNDLVADVYTAIKGGERSEVLPSFGDGLRAALIAEAVVTSAATSEWTTVTPSDIYLDENIVAHSSPHGKE